ncbi:MAG TPA: LysR substrate-binding domain-containing protein [Ideonella sp.]|uniref:LysR substrate-binding domain-containing protein n=1 Tax=Ideonella sp. TaxID=1929293 RepID=UPI002E2FB8D4|nr:LysR substrate-binding domain-containing protein [Ideonella sp.]HEX5687706.1 LysR substrate-binding domain-containing protein [Ideonella sp.]
MPHPADRVAARLLRTLSLDALRGFEAAARRLNFTLASDELCVTQSAVSKQIKSLEEAIGQTLFVRGARGLSLTPAGRALYSGVAPALQQLAQALEPLVNRERQTVSITVTPSFASLWLAPRLAAFHHEHPSIDVRVDAAESNLALEREGFDLAVRLAQSGESGADPDPLCRRLTQERLMLVAAPSLAGHVRSAEDLRRLPLLVFHHAVERHPWMSWSHWFSELGLARHAGQPVLQFSQYEHVIRAAIEGAGVAIGRAPLVLPCLQTRQLQVVLPEVQADGLDYLLLMSERSVQRAQVQTLAAWIERTLATDGMG